MNEIMQHVAPRTKADAVRRRLRRLRRELSVARQHDRAYQDGLPGELTSLAMRVDSRKRWSRQQRQSIILSRAGRRIDLVALLNLRNDQNNPIWAIRDPRCSRQQLESEGRLDDDNSVRISGIWQYLKGLENHGRKIKPAGGIPPIPPRVRRIVRKKSLTSRAKWLGLLYQPESWEEVNPDPAIVVEWNSLPGEYYALAVWGADMPRIMEFVT